MGEQRRRRADLRHTHDRLARLVIDDGLADAADLDELCRRVASRSGRPIELLAMPLAGGTLHGVLVTTDDTDYIAYDPRRSAAHREHVILHELSHLICGHMDQDARQFPTEVVGTAAEAIGAPVTRALGRHGYLDAQEVEAEMLASLLGQRIERHTGSRHEQLPLPLRRLGGSGTHPL